MKLLTSPLLLLVMGFLTLVSCRQAVEDMPMPVKAETPASDLCAHVGTVMQSTCGLYIQLESGRKIFTEDSRGFTMREGAQVVVGFRLANVPAQSSSQQTSSSSSGSSGGCGSSGDASSQMNNCMASQSIAQVDLTCIRTHDAGNGDQ